MKIHNNIKPIVVTLIAIGFFALLKWQFPIYKVAQDSMFGPYSRGNYLLVTDWQTIQCGDVVVFEQNEKLQVSRVVAEPNDRLECRDAWLFRNDVLLDFESEHHGYLIYCNPSIDLSLVQGFVELYPKREYKALLNQTEVDRIKLFPGVEKVIKQIEPMSAVPAVTKKYNRSYWSKDNFGPLQVPQESYFLMNDNRVMTNDSRSLGPISTEAIVGKVIFHL